MGIIARGQRATARKVQSDCNLERVSIRTVQNRLNEFGMKFGKASRKIVQTNAHKKGRLLFVRSALTNLDRFRIMIWTDEKRSDSDGPDNCSS